MMLHLIPQWLEPYILPFFILQYPIPTPAKPDSFPTSQHYSVGPLDACYVVSAILALAALREVVRLGLMEPLARWWLTPKAERRKGAATPTMLQPSPTSNNKIEINGVSTLSRRSNRTKSGREEPPKLQKITKHRSKGMTKEQWLRERSVLRFAEQGWAFVYYSCSTALGYYIHTNLPHSPFRPAFLWLNYPHTALAGPVKFYYLTQFASWIHQLIVLNAEARRKDHYQMASHHIITIALLVASYFTNFTRVGCIILLIMDWCDIWLPFVKMAKYLQMEKLTDASFVFYLLSWIVTRHILFGWLIWSAYSDTPQLIEFGWAPERGFYFTKDWYWIFLSLLVALQMLLCFWLYTIVRIAYLVVIGSGAEDTRSDEEGESPPSEEGIEEDDEFFGTNEITQATPTSAWDERKLKAQ